MCINQTDDAEKASQVKKMLDIYRRAAQVLVWLGPADKTSDLALVLMLKMPSVNFQTYMMGITQEILDEWNALRMLFRRPWWSRVWVGGEIVCSASVTSAPSDSISCDGLRRLVGNVNISVFGGFSTDTAPSAPPEFWNFMQVLMGRAQIPADFGPQLPPTDRKDRYIYRLVASLHCMMSGMRFFITTQGFLGIGPASTQVGDRVAVIFGLRMPVVLRTVDESAWT